MAVRREPKNWKNHKYPPQNGIPHRARRDESLESIARDHAAANHLSSYMWQQLAIYNFGTADPVEVNWWLYQKVGCRKETRDGNNYILTPQTQPGIIYLPPAVHIEPPLPLLREPFDTSTSKESLCVAGVPRANDSSGDLALLNCSCATVADYIRVVQKIERIYEAIGGGPSVAELVTSLRRVWNRGEYNKPVWDVLLHQARTPPLDLYLSHYDANLQLDDEDRRVLATVQCLWTNMHGCIDFGHVLTGIDATFHPAAESCLLPEIDESLKVLGSATWAGDVGSVYMQLRKRENGWEKHDIDIYWDNYAHDDDLLGDVDGVVLGSQLANFSSGSNSMFGLSSQLRNYYGVNTVTVKMPDAPSRQSQVFTDFERIYRMGDRDINRYVQAFVDAQELGTPQWDLELLSRLRERWRQFVSQRQAAQVIHEDSEFLNDSRHNHVLERAAHNYEEDAFRRVPRRNWGDGWPRKWLVACPNADQ